MTEGQLRTRRHMTLVYLYTIWALWGVAAGVLAQAARTDVVARVAERALLILMLALQLGFMWFCTIDAKLAGRSLLRLARIGIFFGWPLGVPIYLIWAHGARGLWTLLLHGGLLLVGSLGPVVIDGLLLHLALGRTMRCSG